MSKMTAEEIERRDKREAAIHEAGHLTVGLALGIRGSAWVYKSQTVDPENEKLWIGKHESQGPITAAAALSGLVAECWVDNRATRPDEITDWIDDGLVSPSSTDSALFPATYVEKLAAVVESHELLLKHKVFFEWAIEKLVNAEVVTDGMAADQWREFYQ